MVNRNLTQTFDEARISQFGVNVHILKSQLIGFTCKTESYLTRPNCIQVKIKRDLILYDDPERRIVVIIHLLK